MLPGFSMTSNATGCPTVAVLDDGEKLILVKGAAWLLVSCCFWTKNTEKGIAMRSTTINPKKSIFLADIKLSYRRTEGVSTPVLL